MVTELCRNALAFLRWRFVLLLGLLVLSGLAEGLGLAALLPLLEKFGVGQGPASNTLQLTVHRVLEAVGIPNAFGPLLITIVSLMCLQVLLQLAKGWVESDCQTRYTAYWQQRIFSAFINAQWMFFANEKASSRVNAVVTEAGRISAAFYLLVQVIASAVLMAIYAGLSLLASWQMVVLFAGCGVLIYLALRPLNWHGRQIGESISVVSEALQHRTTEFIHSAKMIKATATEPVAMSLFAKATEDYRLAYRRAGFHSKLVLGIYMLAGYLILAIAMWTTVEYMSVNPAVVLLSIYVFLRLYVQLSNLQQNVQSMLMSLPAFPAAMHQVSNAQIMQERLTGGRCLPEGPAHIVLDEVSAAYGATLALDRVSFAVPVGSCIGITGLSGAGKSTLIDILVGLVKPSSGKVVIDGISLAEASLSDWRRSIGYVAQDTVLLNGTVGENIAWGTDFDRERIEEAARSADAHGFICNLPNDYDTEVGDRGVRLSGGQRQRLGLARALIGEKRLLVLDEATSALDSESEHAIMRALSAMRGKMTILIVAHRLSTLRDADRIIVLERGRMIEAGNWDELIGMQGSFNRLLQLQDLARVPT